MQAAAGWMGVIALGQTRNFSDLGWIVAMGILALGGHIGITLAFQKASVSVVAPFEYTALVWATVLGLAVFGDFPGRSVFDQHLIRFSLPTFGPSWSSSRSRSSGQSLARVEIGASLRLAVRAGLKRGEKPSS